MVMMMMMAMVMTMAYIMTMFTIIVDQDDAYRYMTINLGQCHGNIVNWTIFKMLI